MGGVYHEEGSMKNLIEELTSDMGSKKESMSMHEVEVCVNRMLMIQLRANGQGGELNRNMKMKWWLIAPR